MQIRRSDDDDRPRILAIINEAAASVGDPAFSRIARPLWRDFFNRSCRDAARKLKLVRWRATFDIVAGDDEYALPSDLRQVVKVEYNDTPSDPTTWWKVEEMMPDEFEEATNGAYPEGRPDRYIAFIDTLHLVSMPDTDVVGGGRITYWGMPDDITDEATQSLPLMDIMRDTIRERMEIYALRRLERFDKAQKAEEEWLASLTTDRSQLEDRTDDKRPRLRSGLTSFGER